MKSVHKRQIKLPAVCKWKIKHTSLKCTRHELRMCTSERLYAPIHTQQNLVIVLHLITIHNLLTLMKSFNFQGFNPYQEELKNQLRIPLKKRIYTYKYLRPNLQQQHYR